LKIFFGISFARYFKGLAVAINRTKVNLSGELKMNNGKCNERANEKTA